MWLCTSALCVPGNAGDQRHEAERCTLRMRILSISLFFFFLPLYSRPLFEPLATAKDSSRCVSNYSDRPTFGPYGEVSPHSISAQISFPLSRLTPKNLSLSRELSIFVPVVVHIVAVHFDSYANKKHKRCFC